MFTTSGDREIVKTRLLDAPRRLVVEAWTKPEHLPKWMLGPSGSSTPSRRTATGRRRRLSPDHHR